MKKLLGLVVALTASATPGIASAGDNPRLGQDAKTILQTYCADCHGGGKAIKGGFGFVLDRDLLVSRGLIHPGQANQSDLFIRIQQGEMPPKSAKKPLSAAEVKVLKHWIDAGAPAFAAGLKSTRILTPPEVTDVILADLQKLDPRQHRFTRYLTLAHHAMAARSAEDLALTREAAGKLLNSLSWHQRITKPDPVDDDATILRIDLRSFKWTAAQWERLVAAYPYRLQSNAESKALASITGSEFPALRADWFVATASRPPHYQDLLQLPQTDRALERLLQVDVAADIQDDNILRTGFNDSGVSKNNRLLERHDSAYGTYWRSYDFSANNGRQSLFVHPLGPNAGATSFQAAGGEMIFHLPNGLQAYMLVDAKGKRIDKGPIEIVADPRRPDQKVETGISCMSCHARGLLFKTDQLRDHVEKNALEFGKQVVDAIRATHPRKARLQTQINEDNVRYLKALEKFGVRDPDQEPVNLVTLRYEATINGQYAAAELGLKIEDFSAYLKQNADHARIFGGLLVKYGTVQRSVFQENFPEMARRVLVMQAAVAAKAKPRIEAGFEGHTATVNAIAFSADGAAAASGSDDRTVRVWTVPFGTSLLTLDAANMGEVYTVAFSPDGKFLLSGGRDRLMRLWDIEKKKQVRTFRGHTDSVRSVAFSFDGKRAVSAGDDRSIRVWDIGSGDEIAALAGHTEGVTSVVWSRDNQKLMSAGRDGTLRWWNVAGQKEVFRLQGHAGPVLSVALSNDGKTAISGGNDHTIRLWSVPERKELHAFNGHATAVVHVAFHGKGGEFDSHGSQHRSADNVWRRWTLSDRKEIAARKSATEDSFGCASVSSDGRYVLVGGPGGFLRLSSW